jgi:hypothetical protein
MAPNEPPLPTVPDSGFQQVLVCQQYRSTWIPFILAAECEAGIARRLIYANNVSASQFPSGLIALLNYAVSE